MKALLNLAYTVSESLDANGQRRVLTFTATDPSGLRVRQTYRVNPDNYALGLEAVACESGEVLARQQVEVGGKEEVLAGQGTVAMEITHASVSQSRDPSSAAMPAGDRNCPGSSPFLPHVARTFPS